MRIHSVVGALAFLLAGTTAAMAAQPNWSIGVGRLTGCAKYQIGRQIQYADGTSERIHLPVSELEFPLDAVMVRLDAGWRPMERLNLKVGGQTNVTDETGKMGDRDWLIGAEQPDILSRSDAEMRSWMFEASVQYDAWLIPFHARGAMYTMTHFVGFGLNHQ